MQFYNEAEICTYWLVNETLWYKTETFDFQSETRSRPRPSHVSTRPKRDGDVWKLRIETVSRPRLHPWLSHIMTSSAIAEGQCDVPCQLPSMASSYGTRPRHLIFSPRRDRDRDLPTFPQDPDETETFGNYVSRPSRDRDYIPGYHT